MQSITYVSGCSLGMTCTSPKSHFEVELTAENSTQYYVVSSCDFITMTVPSILLHPTCEVPKWYHQSELTGGTEELIKEAKSISWSIDLSKPEVFGVYCIKSMCAEQKYCTALAGILCNS